MAWRTDFTSLSGGVLGGDKFSGTWQVMTVPSPNVPEEGWVCNGLPTSGTYANQVFLGYYTDAYYERGYIK